MQTRRLEDILSALIDYRGKTPEKTSSGVRLVTAKVIKDGFINDSSPEYIAEAEYDSWMRRGLPRIKDILVTTEAPLGEVAQIRETAKIALAQRVILLRSDGAILDQDYLFHAMKSPFVQAELSRRATGTTVLGIKQSELRQIQIPYFELLTQKRIAAVLSRYDDLLENNTRRIKLLEEIAGLLYREWFVDLRYPGYGSVSSSDTASLPAGWSMSVASKAVDISPRTHVPKDGSNAFVPMTSLDTKSMVIDGIEQKVGNSGAKFQAGDTLFARISPCMENGKTAFVYRLPEGHAAAFGSTEFIVLRGRLLSPEMVYLLARTPAFREHAQKSMSGATGRQRVQEACFDTYSLVVPPAHLVERFTGIVRPMFDLIHKLSGRNSTLRRTRDLLLPKLMSGELDVSRVPLPEEVTEAPVVAEVSSIGEALGEGEAFALTSPTGKAKRGRPQKQG